MILIYTILLTFTTFLSVESDSALTPQQANAPFRVYWNSKTAACQKRYGVNIDVAKYGIISNSYPASGWDGDKITIFNADVACTTLGKICLDKWPYIKDDGTHVHGGIPQSGDVADHLAAWQLAVNKWIPDKAFDGLAIIDMEHWRPLYSTNFWGGKLGRYQRASIDAVRQAHPTWTDTQIKALAETEFDEAARVFLERTIWLSQELRPNAQWGYYIFPLCWAGNDTDTPCADGAYKYNQRLNWLAKDSDVLYPSSYFGDSWPVDEATGKGRLAVYGSNSIAFNWTSSIKEPLKPIYQYTKYSSYKVDKFYGELDLVNSIGLTADQGADGVLIWGNNYNNNQGKDKCIEVKSYIESTLGPYVQKVLNFTNQCSRDLCNSNGRCVRKVISLDMSVVLPDYKDDHVYNVETAMKQYKCSCYRGWAGSACAQQ